MGYSREVMQHYSFAGHGLDLERSMIVQRLQAEVTHLADRAIVAACIDAAKSNGVDDLYLIDEAFLIAALREKIEREKAGSAHGTPAKASWEMLGRECGRPKLRCRRCGYTWTRREGEATEYCQSCGAKMTFRRESQWQTLD